VNPEGTGGAVRFHRVVSSRYANAIREADAEAIGSWIEERIQSGHSPRDFLVLTFGRRDLPAYARQMELRDIPFQVAGAEPGDEEELAELLLLLRALADPDDPVLTVAALRGLYFGLSDQELYDHRRAGGGWSYLAEGNRGEATVLEALAQLLQLWELVRSRPADVSVPEIADRLGVLPYAASGELGAMRAGTVLYALDAVHAAAARGDTSLHGAIEALQVALAVDEAEAPLVQGATDTVRLMNLHKAKGLEAPIVVLAAPTDPPDHPPTRHVVRDALGRATGWMLVQDGAGRARRTAARPPRWEEHAEAEVPFAAAERDRLLYVASTRPREELLISRSDHTTLTSCWAALHRVLDEGAVAEEIAISRTDPAERKAASPSAAEVAAGIAAAAGRRRTLAAATYRDASVTARVKHGRVSGSGTAARGADWGTAVHEALEAAIAGTSPGALRAQCCQLLVALDRPTDAAGEPAELDELLALVARVVESPLWIRAMAADQVIPEATFSLTLPGETLRNLLAGDRNGESDPGEYAPLETVHGVIDLVFRETDGWVIVDYKSDDLTDPAIREARLPQYRRQVDLYAACWAEITGEPVRERILFLTSHGEIDRW